MHANRNPTHVPTPTPTPTPTRNRTPTRTATRVATLGMLLGVAGAWAAILAASGIWLLLAGPPTWPAASLLCAVGGVTMIAAGQLVFLVCVADRCFPLAGRVIGPWIELPLSIVLIAGCGWIVADLAGFLLTGVL